MKSTVESAAMWNLCLPTITLIEGWNRLVYYLGDYFKITKVIIWSSILKTDLH